MGAILGGLMALIVLVLVVLAFVFWIWMLVDCIKNSRLSDTEKIVWVLAIFCIGALIYRLMDDDKRSATPPVPPAQPTPPGPPHT